MCYYRHYIFVGCGHCIPSSDPICICPLAAAALVSRSNKTPSNDSAVSERAAVGEHREMVPEGGHGDGHVECETMSVSSTLCARPEEGCMPQHDGTMARVNGEDSSGGEALGGGSDDGEWKTSDAVSGCGERLGHPVHSFKIHKSCPACTRKRDSELHALDGTLQDVCWDGRARPSRTFVTERLVGWGGAGSMGGMGDAKRSRAKRLECREDIPSKSFLNHLKMV
ncbi:hypothetical protein BS50DRAFT_230154 [Corynespora cassiicola Philippines]|uniref:Uncharacterized protein n=1 Tax=Corynespora cassiicola Philippines TaxID=1448308 RepID=A0A2T2N2A3_CORCC|nr:hypothetical protein BS50DRAFT_230154 [Corynespora cassiicola Philippines]